MRRLWQHLGLQPFVDWQIALQNTNFKDDKYLASQIDSIFGLRNGRYQLLVVMFDSDEKKNGACMCPKTKGPSTANILRAANLPIPSAVVLPYKEYEHFFVACLPLWAGRQVIDPMTQQPLCTFVDDTSNALNMLNGRDGKGPIDEYIAAGEGYRETTHQLALTQMLDFTHLQRPEIDPLVPAFGTLCRASHFLAQQLVNPAPAAVYPPAA
jgi:hypothetical protein